MVSENARVLEAVELLRAGHLRDLGPIFLASHASLRDDFDVSVPALDEVVDRAMASGAVGARMTGAGFGGCALALVPDERMRRVSDAFAGSAFRRPPRRRCAARRSHAVASSG